MRHFLFEFITGGGLADQDLSESLVREGELMMQTLLNEISELDGSDITLCRDSRLELYDKKVKQHIVDGNIKEKISDCIKESDVSWLIAPETDRCLEEYAKLFIENGQLFIGSSVEAIRITTSKFLTNKILIEQNVQAIETKWPEEFLPESNSGWVVKADDGVGAENSRLIEDKESLIKFVDDIDPKKMVVQPFIKGNHMSMSVLAFNGEARLLSCNKQYIDIKDGIIKLTALGINECLSYKVKMLGLAEKVVAAIPGLAGYIGIDLIEVDNELLVLEVNPRFTTAYAGISESLGINITSSILDTFLNKKLPFVSLDAAKPVRINI